MKQQYIGFADSDKFLAAIDITKPINLNVGRQFGRQDAKFGISVDCTVVHMSQGNAQEVLYFQHVTQRYQAAGGHILDKDEDRPVRLGEQVLFAAKQYLADHNVPYRMALLSMPRSYVTLDGQATFLRFDKETDSFLYKKEVTA